MQSAVCLPALPSVRRRALRGRMRRARPALRASWVSANAASPGQGQNKDGDGRPIEGGGLVFVAQGGNGTVTITGSNATGIYVQAREPRRERSVCVCAPSRVRAHARGMHSLARCRDQ